MELLTSVLVAGGVCACIGAVKAVCRRLTKDDRSHPAPQEKSAVRRIFSTYLQFSQPVRRPQPCR